MFMQAAGELLAFATDEVSSLEEVMVRGLSGMLTRLDYLAGATVDSQGQVIPIYEPQGLMRLARSGAARERGHCRGRQNRSAFTGSRRFLERAQSP